MKRTSDKHLFKVVVLAAFFAIVVYFQRKTVTSNVVEDLNRLEWQSSKHSDDSYLQAYRLSNQVGYKTRNLKWFTEGQNRRGVNLLGGSKNGTGSGDSDDSEVRKPVYLMTMWWITLKKVDMRFFVQRFDVLSRHPWKNSLGELW